MATAQGHLDKISNTYDDDVATDAVESLIALGAAALPTLHGFLTIEGFTSAGSCDKGERLYYVLKALDRIGDESSWKPALELFVGIGELDNPNYASSLEQLYNFAKSSDPESCSDLPSSPNFYDSAVRARVLETVKACLSAA